MPKFFINDNQVIEEKDVKIIGEDVKHIKDVLRLKKEDLIQVCNLDKKENYICKILDFKDEYILCEISNQIDSGVEPKNEVTIYQALPKQEKMELILQKSTEIGMKELVPIITKRCIVKLDEKTKQKKVERWQKIVESAAKQSGRDIIPQVSNPININKLADEIKKYDLFLIAYEKEEENTLKQELRKLTNKKNKIAVLIGPEGGLEEEEVLSLKENGAKVITLGKRILRTETVALNVISNIIYELEV